MMPPKSDIFVNYEGPRLSRDQKLVVRSQAMVSFRAKKKETTNQSEYSPIAGGLANRDHRENCRARNNFRQRRVHPCPIPRRQCPLSNSSLLRTRAETARDVTESLGLAQRRAQKLVPILPRPCDIGPTGHHHTGIHARVFQNYLCLCGACKCLGTGRHLTLTQVLTSHLQIHHTLMKHTSLLDSTSPTSSGLT